MKQRSDRKKLGMIVFFAAFFVIIGALSAQAQLRNRIVILPFYVEQGNTPGTANSDLGFHYRRMSGFIENHLVSHDFEVIDPFARNANDRELNRIMEKAEKDSLLVASNLCQKFAVDAVYIVWLKVKSKKTSDGYYKASAMLDGKGYDSGGRSLGANVMKTFKVTRTDFDEAIAVVEKEVGDVVGRTLTNWGRSNQARNVVSHSGVSSSYSGSASSGQGQGVLARNMTNQARYINLRLDQANEYELVEVFGKILHTARGVVHQRRYSQRIIPDNPQACVTEWEVEIDPRVTDPFRMQANIMKIVNDILDAGGAIRINGVPYRYSASEMKLMMGVRPGGATSRSVQFVVDRERARDREFANQHNPETAVKKSSPGFE